MGIVRVHVFVSGKVQGVSFRSNTAKKAREVGICGWVRNLSDGRVEAVFEGSEDCVEEMVDFCRKGPFGARVENVEIGREVPKKESGFTVRY